MLRTLVLAVDLGGFARAARRVGRTQSAVSLQMRRLEESARQPLFTRAGRSFALTTAGEQVLGYACRLLAINDEAVSAVRGRGSGAGYAAARAPLPPVTGAGLATAARPRAICTGLASSGLVAC